MSMMRISAKLSKKVAATALAVVMATSVFAASDVTAQTGSRVGATTAPLTTIQVSALDEIARIRTLLQDGRASDAVEAARNYIFALEAARFNDMTVHYKAINAYCAALSANGQYEESVAACDSAVDLLPGRWQAYNTRGSAHYAAGKFSLAEEQYRKALSVAPPDGNIAQLLLNNIRIAQSRIAG
jgi:tetratricopeptide (TPR) repeat protein